MATKTPPELVKALADWMHAHAVPQTDWDEVTQAALAELDAHHQNDEQVFENPAEGFRRGWRDMLEPVMHFALIPQLLLHQVEGETCKSRIEVPRPEGEGFRVRVIFR